MKISIILLLLTFADLSLGALSPREERLKRLAPELVARNHSQAYFASIYWIVTDGLRKKISDNRFDRTECVELLLEEFLTMYFDALDAPAIAPLAWQEAFMARTKPSIHLLLGLNAHISHDLPVSMYRVSKKYPECSAQVIRNDYFYLNNFFSELIPKLNLELKRTHQLMSHQKHNVIDFIATETISAFVKHMRRDAWSDFVLLTRQATFRQWRKQLEVIQAKALRRAKLYLELSPITPATGF